MGMDTKPSGTRPHTKTTRFRGSRRRGRVQAGALLDILLLGTRPQPHQRHLPVLAEVGEAQTKAIETFCSGTIAPEYRDILRCSKFSDEHTTSCLNESDQRSNRHTLLLLSASVSDQPIVLTLSINRTTVDTQPD